jgi:hypothetical protein
MYVPTNTSILDCIECTVCSEVQYVHQLDLYLQIHVCAGLDHVDNQKAGADLLTNSVVPDPRPVPGRV